MRSPGIGLQHVAKLHRRVFAAVEHHAVLRHRFVGAVALAREQQRVGFFAAFGQQRAQALGDDAGNAFAQADVGQQFGAVAVAGKAQQLLPDRPGFAGLVVGQAFRCLRRAAPASASSRPGLRIRPGQRLEVVADLGARARRCCTKPSQAGFGVDCAAVMTSTTSPFFSSVRSGTCSPLILADTVRSPTSLWMA